jgi:hypothetical protein
MKGLTAAALAVMLADGSGLALAQGRPRTEAKETCAAVAPPPPVLAGWDKPTDLAAARRPAELDKARLVPGQPIIAHLFPVEQVDYRVPPAKADGPQVYGGLYTLTVAQAGTYRIASSAGPWMDVFVDKTPVISVAHGHGPACSGVGKMVDFPLQPGQYLVQFSESLVPQTEIMAALLPNTAPALPR